MNALSTCNTTVILDFRNLTYVLTHVSISENRRELLRTIANYFAGRIEAAPPGGLGERVTVSDFKVC